jgi:predicted acyl esterase
MADNKPEKITIREKYYDGTEADVIFMPSPKMVGATDTGDTSDLGDYVNFVYPPLNRRTYVQDHMQVEQDVAIPLRDGTVVYADVIRPVNQLTNLPIIIAGAHFGKRTNEGKSDWNLFGVPPQTTSELCKVEGPDPSFWTGRGYAVVNVDPRGAGCSEGNLVVWGEQQGRDGADIVEWLGSQSWSNGRVGFFGNSGLAMWQWFVATEQPEHLACIAPWEGSTDFYREIYFEGGIPEVGFSIWTNMGLNGPNYIEDQVAMAQTYPLMNAYWESKRCKLEKVVVPCYTTIGFTNLHCRGTMNAWRKIRSPKKWIRMHRELEWPDTYNPANLDDLDRFFERYLKGVHNGWELTPRVRLQVMDAYDCDYQTNRPENEFPLKRTQYTKLYLDAASSILNKEPVAAESQVSYDSTTGEADFDITFDEDTELSGYMKLHAFVEADGSNDMDLFLTAMKLDADGNEINTWIVNEPHPGEWGQCRVSHRELDEELSTDFDPVMAHKREQLLSKGEIVEINVEFVPWSRIWHKGEKLRLRIAGRYIRDENWTFPNAWNLRNEGNHIIHTGGQYESFLQIPVIPPKYQAGDYVYR